jgi:hypothetical protein
MSAISTAQAAARINSSCDAIWRMGDRDECSIKHVAHALAALTTGREWTDGVDYSTPWGEPVTFYAGEWREWPQSTIDARMKQLAAKWSKVVALRDSIGAEAFTEAVKASKFGAFAESYRDLYWSKP